MPSAFILVNADIGAEEEVLRGLEPISEVKEAHMVYGVYDIITRLETKTMQDMKDDFSTTIRLLNNVRSTLTIIVVE